jgi:hypothetical protein
MINFASCRSLKNTNGKGKIKLGIRGRNNFLYNSFRAGIAFFTRLYIKIFCYVYKPHCETIVLLVYSKYIFLLLCIFLTKRFYICNRNVSL